MICISTGRDNTGENSTRPKNGRVFFDAERQAAEFIPRRQSVLSSVLLFFFLLAAEQTAHSIRKLAAQHG